MKLSRLKLDAEVGDKVTFDEVLMTSKDGEISVGRPFLDNVKVNGVVEEQGKGDKVIVFKFKRKKTIVKNADTDNCIQKSVSNPSKRNDYRPSEKRQKAASSSKRAFDAGALR